MYFFCTRIQKKNNNNNNNSNSLYLGGRKIKKVVYVQEARKSIFNNEKYITVS